MQLHPSAMTPLILSLFQARRYVEILTNHPWIPYTILYVLPLSLPSSDLSYVQAVEVWICSFHTIGRIAQLVRVLVAQSPKRVSSRLPWLN
jgi:hypothetical protein